MYSDVVDLYSFYQSHLGHVAQRMIRRRLRQMWPSVRGQSVLGIGYALPYLRPFLEETDRVFCAMPAQQGVIAWPYDPVHHQYDAVNVPDNPRKYGNRVVMVDEHRLPFDDLSLDRVLVVHAAECTDQLRHLFREIWRVLHGQGQVMVIVPNRTGIWARVERTPFGHGTPFTNTQMVSTLRDALFVPQRTAGALFMPPTRFRFMMSSAPAWEEIGERWFDPLAGVNFIEATKQIYAGTAIPAARPRKPVLIPVPRPGRSLNHTPQHREPS